RDDVGVGCLARQLVSHQGARAEDPDAVGHGEDLGDVVDDGTPGLGHRPLSEPLGADATAAGTAHLGGDTVIKSFSGETTAGGSLDATASTFRMFSASFLSVTSVQVRSCAASRQNVFTQSHTSLGTTWLMSKNRRGWFCAG